MVAFLSSKSGLASLWKLRGGFITPSLCKDLILPISINGCTPKQYIYNIHCFWDTVTVIPYFVYGKPLVIFGYLKSLLDISNCLWIYKNRFMDNQKSIIWLSKNWIGDMQKFDHCFPKKYFFILDIHSLIYDSPLFNLLMSLIMDIKYSGLFMDIQNPI